MDNRTRSTAAVVHIPPFSPTSASSSSLGPLTSDFVRQQVAKQDRSNYHSSSLKTMVAATVNPTRLHPTGVQYVAPSLSPYPPIIIHLRYLSVCTGILVITLPHMLPIPGLKYVTVSDRGYPLQDPVSALILHIHRPLPYPSSIKCTPCSTPFTIPSYHGYSFWSDQVTSRNNGR